MHEVTKSAIWALALSVPATLAGIWMAFGLAHSGKVLDFIPFLPAIGVLMILGDGGPIPVKSDGVILAIGFIAQFLGYFAVIHSLRTLRRRARNRSAERPNPSRW